MKGIDFRIGVKSRDEIEDDLKQQGYKVEFEDRDDQIWMNKEQDILLFVSWISCSIYEYKRERIIDL